MCFVALSHTKYLPEHTLHTHRLHSFMKVIYVKDQQGNLKLYEEQVEYEDHTKDQQTSNADLNSDENDEVDYQDDTIDGDDVIDGQDEFVDQHKELIQTTASVSKQRRKRKNLTASKNKSKKVRFSL